MWTFLPPFLRKISCFRRPRLSRSKGTTRFLMSSLFKNPFCSFIHPSMFGLCNSTFFLAQRRSTIRVFSVAYDFPMLTFPTILMFLSFKARPIDDVFFNDPRFLDVDQGFDFKVTFSLRHSVDPIFNGCYWCLNWFYLLNELFLYLILCPNQVIYDNFYQKPFYSWSLFFDADQQSSISVLIF